MARHDQRPDRQLMVCPNCKAGACEVCIDVLRAVYTEKPLCRCTRQGHGGEPVEQQILDPETNVVYCPDMSVSLDGEVKRNE